MDYQSLVFVVVAAVFWLCWVFVACGLSLVTASGSYSPLKLLSVEACGLLAAVASPVDHRLSVHRLH